MTEELFSYVFWKETVLRMSEKNNLKRQKKIFYSQYQVKTIKTGKPKVTHYDLIFTNAYINELIAT